MKLFNGKDIHIKSLIVSSIVTLCAFVLTIPFFFFNMMDIPLGILLGGVFHGIFFYLFHITEGKMKATVAVQITRTVGFGITAIGLAYIYVNKGFKIFNPFAYLGAYAAILIIYIIIARKEKNNG